MRTEPLTIDLVNKTSAEIGVDVGRSMSRCLRFSRGMSGNMLPSRRLVASFMLGFTLLIFVSRVWSVGLTAPIIQAILL